MTSQTNEQALETHIEKSLVGITPDVSDFKGVSEPSEIYGSQGYYVGNPIDFNKKYALDEKRFFDFLENSQPEELEKLKRDSDWKLKIMDRFHKMAQRYGILRLLRKGLGVDNAHFALFYVAPLANSGKSVRENFKKNQFSVTRQLAYSIDHPGQEIDMVIFINGIPISTMELKNAWTGQTARVNGIRQYKQDRDPTQTLLNFGRCIVHFAVDTDEIFMTTRLAGEKTIFLPFNKGYNNGKGNPPNDFGHKTSYLWKEIFQKESISQIIQNFVRFDGKSEDPLSKKNILFFPRYHQLNVVRKIIADAAVNGVGKRYLIQHSAGSGKSLSITWLAYQLIGIYPENEEAAGNRSMNQQLFDSVLVVTDRRLLDKQLREDIKGFSQAKNIVAAAYSSAELRRAMESGRRIIVTTIQKFPFIVDEISDMSNKQFGVIIDEAHSSQSGTTADNLNQAISGSDGEEEEDYQDRINRIMESRKMSRNASYFAFTATPKNNTLEKFGVKQSDGSFKPFHLYSMKQAIEEGFILDVLSNYTTYRSYYEIEKSIEDNPLFDSGRAQKKLKAFVEKNEQTISIKAEIMFDHFMNSVVKTKKLKAKAKGMVICQSIESAIRYYKALQKELTKASNPFKILIAFSGTKKLEGIEYTETQMNGFAENDTRDKFDEDQYRLLVVADKYLTGFDQPKLCAMYVDKRLQGVKAVQALSRLNRSANSLGKKTEDLFVLDFFNEVEDIRLSFNDFYTVTSLERETDVNVLHELKENLEEVGVYEQSEVEEFNKRYFNNMDAEFLSPIIDMAANRFNDELDLENKEKADFKIKAKQFVKIYGQMAAILPFEMMDWEKLFWFLKFLIPKLIVRDAEGDALDELLESVDLSTYGIERTHLSRKIGLDDSGAELTPQNPNPRGAHGESEKDELERIIENFNERWFQGWDATPEEQRVRVISISESIKAHPDYETKVVQTTDPQNKELAFKEILDDIMREKRKQDLDLYKMYAQDASFFHSFLNILMRTTMGNRG